MDTFRRGLAKLGDLPPTFEMAAKLADKWCRLEDKDKERWRAGTSSYFEQQVRGSHGLATKFKDNSDEELALFEVFLARIRYSCVSVCKCVCVRAMVCLRVCKCVYACVLLLMMKMRVLFLSEKECNDGVLNGRFISFCVLQLLRMYTHLHLQEG